VQVDLVVGQHEADALYALVGAANRAHAIATDYASPSGFGTALIDHEGRPASCWPTTRIDLHQSLLTIDHAAWVLDRHGPLRDDTAVSGRAKVAVSEALFRVADRSCRSWAAPASPTTPGSADLPRYPRLPDL